MFILSNDLPNCNVHKYLIIFTSLNKNISICHIPNLSSKLLIMKTHRNVFFIDDARKHIDANIENTGKK